MLQSETYHINSNLRINPTTETHSNFSYRIDLPPNAEFDRVSLLKASIPKSYYNVNEDFSFIVDENGAQTTITMPVGNYQRRAFRTVLQDQLNTLASYTYAITYKNSISQGDDGYFYFTVSGNSGIQPVFIFELGSSALELMGFDGWAGLTKAFSGDALVSENVPNLQAEQTLFIRSNICQNFSDDILGTCFVDTGDFSSITFNCPDVVGYSRQFSRLSSDVYYFRITDENGHVIDLRGVNLVLEIKLFKKDNTRDLMLSMVRLMAAKELQKQIN